LFLGILAGSTLAGHIDPDAKDFAHAYVYSWLNLFSVSIGLFTVALCGFLAAVYLIGEADNEHDRRRFVVKAKVSNLLAVGFGIAGIASLWLINPFYVNGPGEHYKHAPLLSNISPSSYWLAVTGIVGGLALLLAIMVGLGAARQNREDSADPAPLLIVLPEGWVQYIRRRDPAQAIAFAELKHLRQGVAPSQEEITTLADLQKRTVRSRRSTAKSSSSKSHAGPWLDIAWREGNRKDWEPDKCFGKPEAICQAILAAYQSYTTQSRGAADGETSLEE